MGARRGYRTHHSRFDVISDRSGQTPVGLTLVPSTVVRCVRHVLCVSEACCTTYLGCVSPCVAGFTCRCCMRYILRRMKSTAVSCSSADEARPAISTIGPETMFPPPSPPLFLLRTGTISNSPFSGTPPATPGMCGKCPWGPGRSVNCFQT